MKGQPFLNRLRFALQGLGIAFRRERSLRFHFLAGFAVLTALLVIRAPALWWAMGAITIGMVITAELFNAALEALADHLHPQRHPEIGIAKDIAASAVLIASIVALGVALAFILR